MLYDSPECKRINGTRYTADWIPHPKLGLMRFAKRGGTPR